LTVGGSISAEPLNIAERLVRWRSIPVVGRFARLGLLLIGLEVPVEVQLGQRVRFEHNGIGVVVHKTARLGNDVRIYPGVTIGRSDLDRLWSDVDQVGGVVVEDGVVIGTGAKVLFKSGRSIRLGRGCVIGANAVVTSSVPAGEVWAGAPARPLRQRSALTSVDDT
jgi:serine O-acetyltransferase